MSSNAGKSVVRKLGEVDVICRELTVAEVRGLLEGAPPDNVTDAALFADVTLNDLQRFTNLTPEQIDQAQPSQLEAVVEGIKEANPHFFAMLARIQQPLASK